MSEIGTFNEIEKILSKAGYKITRAVFDEENKTLDFKATCNVKTVTFPDMSVYYNPNLGTANGNNNDLQALRSA